MLELSEEKQQHRNLVSAGLPPQGKDTETALLLPEAMQNTSVSGLKEQSRTVHGILLRSSIGGDMISGEYPGSDDMTDSHIGTTEGMRKAVRIFTPDN